MTLHKVSRRIPGRLVPFLPERLIALRYPEEVMIEPSNFCNLRCPLCPTPGMSRSRGRMRVEDFRTIVERLPGSVGHVRLHHAGEPLTNPETFSMCRILAERGVYTSTSTNGMLLGRHIDDVLSCGLDELVVAVDGATAETYEAYRIGGDFEGVIGAIRETCRRKRERGLDRPRVILQFVLMKINEHEQDAIQELSRDLGVDALAVKSVGMDGYRTSEERLSLKERYFPRQQSRSRYVYDGREIRLQKPPAFCPWIAKTLVLWNGDVTICCYDYEGDYVVGNLLEACSFEEIWTGPRYREMRKRMIRRDLELCRWCGYSDDLCLRMVEFHAPRKPARRGEHDDS